MTEGEKAHKKELLAAVHRELRARVELSDEDWARIEPHLQIHQTEAKQSLQAVGESVSRHYFLLRGLVRFYYLSPEGKELNKAFYAEGSIVGNLSALILNEPSRFAIETLEPSVMVVFPFAPLKQLVSDCPGWDRLFNYGCQMMLLRNERREAELLTLSAAERFRQFVQNFPRALERIPQYHIASYLGITPEALSRFKRQWLLEVAADDPHT